MFEEEEKKSDNQMQDATTVAQVDVNIDEIFGMPGAENVMLPEDSKEPEKTKSIFTKETVDVSFLDKTVNTPDDVVSIKAEVAETIAELDGLISQEEDSGNKGRPKVDKSGLMELAQKMIEDGVLVPFADEDGNEIPLEKYTTKDFRELFEENFDEREKKIKENTPKEFFNSLPEELQIAAKYVADGGQDMKGLFRTLAQMEEMISLDPANEYDQAEIARQYLTATNFGTPEEIDEEINDWKDLDRLEQKANQFKPKLDRMQEEIVARQLAEQEQKKEQQSKAAKVYTDNVYNTLLTGEIGGIKLDKKTQGMLYSGLVQPNYSSISGKPTNMLGHLLEKYQFVEPRHDLIAEALWLLSDPEGYKTKIKDQGSKAATEKTVRMLKTEESRKIASTVNEEEERRTSKPNRTIPKAQTGSMFRRF
jgi:hypothetical protein